jgi:hypothetical protein
MIPKFVVLTPGVFPNVFLWTTQGLTLMLESAVEHFKQPVLSTQGSRTSDQQSLSYQERFYYLQLIAVLERTLAYAYTGSPRVLHKSSMEPLWILSSLRDNSYPVFNPDIINTRVGNSRFALAFEKWPVNRDGYAVLPAERAATLTYGATYAEVSRAHLPLSCKRIWR